MNTDQPKKTEQPEKGALTLMDFQHMKTEERTSTVDSTRKKSCPKNFVLKRKHLYQHENQQNQS